MMSVFERAMTYAGAAVSLVGLELAAAFFGRRTADPLVGLVADEVTIFMRIGGLLLGAALALGGPRIAVQFGNPDRVVAWMENSEE